VTLPETRQVTLSGRDVIYTLLLPVVLMFLLSAVTYFSEQFKPLKILVENLFCVLLLGLC
jgi:hypothetical protein